MIELADGSYQVVDDDSSFRAVATLLEIRAKHAKAAIAATDGVDASEIVSIPPDYVLPNDYISACHRDLKALYLPLIKANWVRRHGGEFSLQSKSNPFGCNLRGA